MKKSSILLNFSQGLSFTRIRVRQLFVSTSQPLRRSKIYMFTSMMVPPKRLSEFKSMLVVPSRRLTLSVLVEETDADLAFLLIESSRRRPVVSFSQSEVKREDIFTITEVEGGYSGFNFLRGTVM